VTPARIRCLLIGTLGLTVGCGSEGGKAPLDASPPDASPPSIQLTGCGTASTHPAAPGGYYVNGNTICTADGRAHLLHGVDRPSLEWSSGGENLSLADFRLMASWNANVVRIALNQDFWIADSPLFDPNYAGMVDTAVAWAETEGMDVILDLHWSDAGVLGCVDPDGCQQQMPDVNSITFWSEVAARYQGDGRVLFELYNEPHDVSWGVWKSGGAASDGFQAVGMQQLYDTVRATGAHNLVIIGGLNWAYDLSGVPANRIDGYNIVYATHPYGTTTGSSRPPSDWGRAWGFLTATDPVVVTEFGVLDDNGCSTAYDAQLIEYADAHFAGWSAWAWFAGDCTTGLITVIDDWTGTPSPTGAVVKAALLGYGDPPASPPGNRVNGPAVNYTFDRGTEGWVVDRYDPDPTNLGAGVPDGESRPTLRFSSTDGDPSAGALVLTVAFTGPDQYVIANVDFGQPGLDLSGKTLHARVRLVSGSLGGGRLIFGALSGPSYLLAETPALDATSLAAGTWVPLSLDLGTTTAVGFDASKIVQVGVRILASAASSDGGTSDGGTFANAGETVFEIDSVTD
jgi:endoglucanase